MRWVAMTVLFGALGLLQGCGSAPQPQTAAALAKPEVPPVPPEIKQVAQSLLGTEAEVLVYGDLAHTGRQQVLVVNRVQKVLKGVVPGILITRAALAEDDGGKWKELLRCDEYLKNPNGYMAGTPVVPVNGWRIQYEQDATKGLLLYFTPLAEAGASHIPTIAVRWNPKVKRYQSLDRNYEQFLGESPQLESLHSYLK